VSKRGYSSPRLARPKMVNPSEGINSQEIDPGSSFQGPDQRSKNGEQTLQPRETSMPTSGQACDV
jgi:hypothetical protein